MERDQIRGRHQLYEDRVFVRLHLVACDFLNSLVFLENFAKNEDDQHNYDCYSIHKPNIRCVQNEGIAVKARIEESFCL